MKRKTLTSMTTRQINPAEMADRHLKSAKSLRDVLNDVHVPTVERERLERDLERDLAAASSYSRLALARAIQRSFPALEGEYAGGQHRADVLPDNAEYVLPGPLAAYGLEQPAEFLGTYFDRTARG